MADEDLQNGPDANDADSSDAGSRSGGPRRGVGAAGNTVVLEMGAFTQLLDAAIRCQLVSGTDLIAYIRDREFRMGDYTKAFQLIEGLFGKFTIAANQRQQRLRREDVDIASGRIVMSPKELQAKRARDSAQNQLVDRCRGRFMRVMEGLRVLISLESPQESESDSNSDPAAESRR